MQLHVGINRVVRIKGGTDNMKITSSKSVLMTSPSGFSIDIVKHIKE